tara:strand:- start:488 stop:592 length:105 start_codon:yes stop_codon:yes gene_type:complete
MPAERCAMEVSDVITRSQLAIIAAVSRKSHILLI